MLRILGKNGTLAFMGTNSHSQTLLCPRKKDKHRGGEAPITVLFSSRPKFRTLSML